MEKIQKILEFSFVKEAFVDQIMSLRTSIGLQSLHAFFNFEARSRSRKSVYY